MPLLPHPRWLLLSDIHFRLRDFERTKRTAEWIVSLVRETPGISRVVVCGDVLTSRSMQPTAVLSAAYRFLSDLSRSVPHINVILGNHDLAYRRDYRTTALEALSMPRLRPFISLHDEVGRHNWDGRDVLVLPFREDQTELTTAVANLNPDEAAHTIAFAHLAINRAVTQRHVVRADSGDTGYPIRYRGLTGPDHFSRTFTGHFHSHQTIIQPDQHALPAGSKDRLKGSLTYLGAPLQMTWADLHDEDRGVVLLNPATLEHKLIINPHAIGYMTVQGSEVLNDAIDASTVKGKHVMILGKSTKFQYWTARDKLLSLGAQSLREPWPMLALRDGLNSFAYSGLGASVPASDRDAALVSGPSSDLPAETSRSIVDEQNESPEPDVLQSVELNPVDYVREYVRSSGIDSMYEEKTILLGQRLLLACDSPDDAEYKELLDPSYSFASRGDSWTSTKNVFVAKPRSIVISNFLGIQEERTIDFDRDLGRGLTFVVGSNGSGKSTLIEAIVWCQFGRCIRKGLSVGDVVNDVADKDCMVSLSFSNGYTITRYRKHKIYGNRVIVSLNGKDQPQFEHGEARASQAAIDELLGIDYEEFIKTVVLGHESAASFLSSTPVQRHDLIDSVLGLSRLDQSDALSRRMLREIDKDATVLRSKISAVEQTMALIKDRIAKKEKELRRLRIEEEKARKAISLACKGSEQSQANDDDLQGRRARRAFEDLRTSNERLEELKLKIKETQQTVDKAQSPMKDVEIWEDVATQLSMSDQRIHATKIQYQALQDELERLKAAQPDLVTMEHIHAFESTLRGLTQTISWLHRHILNTMNYLSSESLVNKITLHFIRIGLRSLEQLSSHLNVIFDQFVFLIPQEQQEGKVTTSVIEKVRTKLAENESKLNRLMKKRDETYARVALDRGLDEQFVRSLSNRLSKTSVQDAKRQLSSSLSYLSKLLAEQGALHKLQARHQRESVKRSEEARNQVILRENLVKKERENLAKAEQDIATYQKLIEEEVSMLDEQRASHAAIGAETESLMAMRELFAFWEGAYSRRRIKSAPASTFRNYVLDKGLQELNKIASNILLVLYENTHHANELTKGMLRTMITADSEYDQDPGSPQSTALLDQTLGVTKTLSYAKRSGGERKRIDLAVFFALVQILQARSTHRARYILVDEAFDSLDAAGQAAVVRWCVQLMTRTDFQLVVTHSDYLASSARDASHNENGDDAGSRFSVLSAMMTKEGTKFSYSKAE
ncbi:P-loop containing nucleoside triphosphate hydrolase protein [Nemania diffusa]|nr:P-loop containing nucleoside triphosphate hydrolase protein [Nemania diffusa]